MIQEVEEDAMLHLFNKNIFGNGDGPAPLPLEERNVVVRLDKTRVTKDEARTMVLCMIETAVKALTLSRTRRLVLRKSKTSRQSCLQ